VEVVEVAEAVSISRLEGSRWCCGGCGLLWGLNANLVPGMTTALAQICGDSYRLQLMLPPDCSDAQERSDFAHRPTDGHAQRLPRQRLLC
jgi:hypothetical protein